MQHDRSTMRAELGPRQGLSRGQGSGPHIPRRVFRHQLWIYRLMLLSIHSWGAEGGGGGMTVWVKNINLKNVNN